MFANRICKSKTLDLGGKTKLRRDEALLFLKELLSESPNMTPEAISLLQSKDPSSYTVHIKEKLSSQTIRDVAQKLNLLMKEEKDTMVVYSPTA